MTEGHTYLRTHDLQAEHMVIDLGEAARDLHAQNTGQDRSGVTLVRQGGLSVVLTHLHAGGSLQEHAAPGAATVHVLGGRVRAQVGDSTLDLSAGQLIAFDANVSHSMEATEDATLLLILADQKTA